MKNEANSLLIKKGYATKWSPADNELFVVCRIA